ncbi:MAG: Asp-tRNA(Asn)/Glu-tRNA(Gln) amidotransferase subunit GatB [bacterium]|nr:Asp-tRNA(Asn)/Glu-tRNA(Gln) amidotransferase subunit GatB [bacterium]
MNYKPTIGLEIHAELKTKTKMFCDSKNDPDEARPNVNICPICMGHPGTLPTINKEAVKHVLKIGLAIGGTLAEVAEFDRKNYFYPDLPKGYQISQYKYPLVSGGKLDGVEIERVHLEEDTGRSAHDAGDYSLVDFNRAGIPLMELVTKPVITSAEEAVHFAKELQLLLRFLGVSEARMEKGEMRVEANVSVLETFASADERRQDADRSRNILRNSATLGTKVEVKNLNSFKSVERAIAYEIKRQSELLEKGDKVVQETRGWDENKGKTFSQRLKEESHDYRYFPDPDLPKLKLSEINDFKNIALPELPSEKRQRYEKNYGLKKEDVEVFIGDIALDNFFKQVIEFLEENQKLVQLVSNYVTSDLVGLIKTHGTSFQNIEPKNFALLIEMAQKGDLSSRGAKDILADMFLKGGNPQDIARKKGLLQKSDEGELQKIVQKIIAENKGVVAEYKAGKEKALQFLIGQGMKETKGSANPQVLEKLFINILKAKH